MQNENIEVTAVMITRNMERHRYVMMSIRSFLNQTYNNARLLIVNDGVPVDIEHPRIHEISLPFKHERTLGDLRNIALDSVTTPLVIQWDDDDWSRSDRIAVQVGAYAPGHAVLLKNQIRYDIQTGECRNVSIWNGIAVTSCGPERQRTGLKRLPVFIGTCRDKSRCNRRPRHKRASQRVLLPGWNGQQSAPEQGCTGPSRAKPPDVECD